MTILNCARITTFRFCLSWWRSREPSPQVHIASDQYFTSSHMIMAGHISFVALLIMTNSLSIPVCNTAAVQRLTWHHLHCLPDSTQTARGATSWMGSRQQMAWLTIARRAAFRRAKFFLASSADAVGRLGTLGMTLRCSVPRPLLPPSFLAVFWHFSRCRCMLDVTGCCCFLVKVIKKKS